MSGFFAWLSTQNGRYFSRAFVGFASLSVFGSHVAVNGPMKERFKEFCQLYRQKEKKELSPKVKQLVEKVLKDSSLPEEKKKKFDFFHVVGLDMYHGGGANSPWGAIIGIPFNFDDSNDINYEDMRLEGQDTIDWIIEGQDLITALTLTENAKKFALMREIYSCNIWETIENASIGAGCMLLIGEFIRRVNVKRDAFVTMKRNHRAFFYAVSYAFGLVLYRLIKDPASHLSAMEHDKKAAETGPQYLEGGIEFYKKCLMRNMALRRLLRAAGRKQFEENGDESYFILAPMLPVRKRLQLLQEMEKAAAEAP